METKKGPNISPEARLLQKLCITKPYCDSNNHLFFKGDLLIEDWFLISPAPSEPLLCKFADGGQKKRQNQSKYTQNGRPWPREGEVSPGWLVQKVGSRQHSEERQDPHVGP